AHGAGSGRRALVIGGAGKMGGWFTRFLASQGFAVLVADPTAAGDDGAHVRDWHTLPDLDAFDFIVVATPMGVSEGILLHLAAPRRRGGVFALASIKWPLRAGLAALKDAGV